MSSHMNPVHPMNFGQYVIFQRKDYKKLHLLSQKTKCVFIGKDEIEINNIIGETFGSVFKLVPKKGCNRRFTLELCTFQDIFTAKESFRELGKSSGLDNRSICDDGASQLLTSDVIEEMRDSGSTPKAIIEHLVENSKTFHIKTEFSQEKYIKKKEKKYFEFLTVRNPTIRLLCEIFYSRDIPKTIGIRADTLSQLITALNFQPDGCYLSVESGFNGIVNANLLNLLSEEGKLIHITPGIQNQKQAVLAMNFSPQRMSQMMTVRYSTLADLLLKLGSSTQHDEGLLEMVDKSIAKGDVLNALGETGSNDVTNHQDLSDNSIERKDDFSLAELRKRKHSNQEPNCEELGLSLKKPRWEMEAKLAIDVLLKKVDGLVIVCKEFPLNIVDKMLEYLLPSRPFVVYSLYQEPLVSLYLHLKQRHDILYLRITETWYRPYQILPERSHPAVTVSSSSGYLLTGLKVINT